MNKYNELISILKSYGKLAIGFSGGVDSTFLAYAAKEALGVGNILLITAVSPLIPARELEESTKIALKLGLQHVRLEFEIDQPEIYTNGADRCYHCKKEIFSRIMNIARENGIIFVAEASNTDDSGDYRPGMKACEELGIVAPLRLAGFNKNEIRKMSQVFLLDTWDKPSYACLASRIPYGDVITGDKLKMVDDAEQFLFDLGYKKARVRVHGNLARIELPEDELESIFTGNLAKRIADQFGMFGFVYTSLDLSGYQMGSLNKLINKEI